MRNFSIAALVFISVFGFTSLTFAGFAEFDFENQALSASLNSLVVTNNGLTATIAQTSSSFSIVDVSGNGTPELGTRTLAPATADHSSLTFQCPSTIFQFSSVILVMIQIH